MKEKDFNTLSEKPYQWRSKEVERQRVLEANGVIAAARHGQAATLKKTLGICIVALAAAGAMVAGGLLMQDATTLPGPAVQLVDEAGSQVAAAERPGLDLAELAVLDNSGNAGAEPNRANCQAISGAAYESESERNWFLDNCVEREPVAAFLAAPELSAVVVQPKTTTSSGPVEVSEGDAIASSIEWIANQQGVVYEVASESCSASEVGELWLVSCQRSVAGCGGEICTSWIAVCVTDIAGTAFASRDC